MVLIHEEHVQNNPDLKLGFIGGASLVDLFVKDWVRLYGPSNVQISHANPDKQANFQAVFKIEAFFDNLRLVQSNDVIVIALKPKELQEVVLLFRDLPAEMVHALNQKLIISLVPGVRTQTIQKWIQTQLRTVCSSSSFPFIPMIRAVPNPAALLHASATALYAHGPVNESQKNSAEALLRSVGLTIWVKHEHELDIVSALSGAGPVYFFWLMELLAQSAVNLGLRAQDAVVLVQQTILGAAKMSVESTSSFSELIAEMAPKGSVAEKGLEYLEETELKNMVQEAVKAAKHHAVEIGDFFAGRD